MRRSFGLIAALPLLSLAACGGAGPQTVSSVAPPAPTAGTGSSGSGSGGSGSGVNTGGTPTPTPASTFLSVSTATTFDAIGAVHSLQTNTDNSYYYAGNASTVRAPSGTIAYDPRDGIFTINFTDEKASVTHTDRFQDPGHRTDFSSTRLDPEVPNLDGFNYLNAIAPGATNTSTFFYQRPGTSTAYVSLAGFVDRQPTKVQRGVFVFGQVTPTTQVPTTGTGSYAGGFLATSVLNKAGDSNNYLQWITGTSAVAVDFAKATLTLDLNGTLGATYLNGTQVNDAALGFGTGTIFAASATAALDLIRSGGFKGEFTSAKLGNTAIDFARVSAGSSTAGASSVDGTFFGPNAVNVGGNFRVIGGVPGQRIDIEGAFNGAKR